MLAVPGDVIEQVLEIVFILKVTCSDLMGKEREAFITSWTGSDAACLALLGDVEVVDAATSQACCGHPIAPIGTHVIVCQD